MTVVVTGAAGFIASHLIPRLLDDHEEVVGIDALTPYYDPAIKRRNLEGYLGRPGFRLLELDLGTDELTDAVRGASCVYHLAGQPGVRASWGVAFAEYVHHNIIGTQRLLEAMRDSSARLVFASSSSVYGDAERYPTAETDLPQPISPYGVTKLCSEQLVLAYRRSSGIDARCVRYFTVYGPRQRPDMAFSRFIAAGLAGRPIELYGDGSQIRDFTFVADAVEATIRAGSAAIAGDPVFNVGGGSQVTVNQVLELLATIIGRPIAVRRTAAQPGDVRQTGADLTRSEAILGWHPAVDLDTGLRAQVAAAMAANADHG